MGKQNHRRREWQAQRLRKEHQGDVWEMWGTWSMFHQIKSCENWGDRSRVGVRSGQSSDNGETCPISEAYFILSPGEPG